MKKILFFLFVSSVLLLSSCTDSSENNVSALKENEMPNPFAQNILSESAQGGDEGFIENYVCQYVFKFENLDSAILNLVDRDECNKWLSDYITESRSDPFIPDPTVLSFVEKFNIPKEKLLDAVSSGTYLEGWTLTDSDIDIIYSGDDELIKKTFVNEYALLYKGKIYTPEWLYEHSATDYINEGLPLDDVTAYLKKMDDFPFTEEAREALSAKTESIMETYSVETAAPEKTETVVITQAPETESAVTTPEVISIP